MTALVLPGERQPSAWLLLNGLVPNPTLGKLKLHLSSKSLIYGISSCLEIGVSLELPGVLRVWNIRSSSIISIFSQPNS